MPKKDAPREALAPPSLLVPLLLLACGMGVEEENEEGRKRESHVSATPPLPPPRNERCLDLVVQSIVEPSSLCGRELGEETVDDMFVACNSAEAHERAWTCLRSDVDGEE